MSTAVVKNRDPFAEYRAAASVFDELRTPAGITHSHWQRFARVFGSQTPIGLERRSRHAERLISENGTTYNIFGSAEGQNRPWEVDLLPLILPQEEWRDLSAGVAQRTRLLALILADIYGPQELLKDRQLPPEVVFGHPDYQRPFCGLPLRVEDRIVLSGTELARASDGRWWVMADRTEAPAGAGYALENRIVISSTWPQLIQDCRVQRLAPFFMRLQETLAELSSRSTENPRIVLLTEGPSNPYYFEDIYLSRYLGYMLVEGGDLAVRSDRVFIKTLDGLLPVDVIFSRIREAALDPLELGGASCHGTPGLLQAIRCGNVALANAPGCGFVESPVLMPFLPTLCRHLLGEELQLQSIATWWCGEEQERQYVLEHLEELVIKPAFEHSGSEEIYGNALTAEQRNQLKAKIRERPAEFVAQEWIARSSAPIWKNQSLQTGYMALRTFTVSSHGRYEVMPGALVRVASSSGPMQLSISAGDGSKDLWVLSAGPVEKVTLLPSPDAPLELRRSSAQLPSR
ncbi:MAG: circularly permuted type 2 ATP-grasp protein, partial [Planctomycetaceae bacterium]|nr:circularly permuted type 2 ATP-grasp protein [Planctomycetaceae bacterium]